MTENIASDEACDELLRYLFGDLDELLTALAPEGWENSRYLRVSHPTVEQRYEESVSMHENLNSLFAEKRQPTPPPTREEIQKSYDEDDHTVEPLKEVLDVFGGGLWSVFSNNHSVTGPDGAEYDLGSFRGTGSTLAAFIGKQFPEAQSFDYLDFYCANLFVERRVNVTPLYELIFQRLKARDCDWTYDFPHLQIVDLSGLKEQLAPENPADYDPEAALAEELEKKKKQEGLAEMRRKLDNAYEQEKEEALYKPPPMVVQAYRNVYSKWPEGWIL